jgi:hypothetical protein
MGYVGDVMASVGTSRINTLLALALAAAPHLVAPTRAAELPDDAPAAAAPASSAGQARPLEVSRPPQDAPPPPPTHAPAPRRGPPPPGQEAPPPEYATPAHGEDAPAADDPPGYLPPPQRAPPAPRLPPRTRGRYERDSWYVGFGVSGGDGTVETSRSTYSFKRYANAWGVARTPTTMGLEARIGATINPWLLLGFDLSFLGSVADDGTASTTLDITNYDLMATVFPFRRGLFLRAGAGSSSLVLDVKNVPTPAGPYSVSRSLSGWNVAGGLGYAFWIGRQFNLTANVDASQQWWNGHAAGQPRRSSFVAVGLGFDWY